MASSAPAHSESANQSDTTLYEQLDIAKREGIAKLCEIYESAKKSFTQSESEIQEKKSSLNARLAEIADVHTKRTGINRVENITDHDNRTSVLVDDYKNFVSDDQMDAADKLKHMKGTEVRLTCRIFEITYETTQTALETLRCHFDTLLSNPTSSTRYRQQGRDEQGKERFELVCGSRQDGTIREMQDEMNTHLSNYLKKTSQHIELQRIAERTNARLVKEIRENKDGNQLIYDSQVETAMLNYINNCARLSWRLATQTPPLYIEYNATAFDTNKHRDPKEKQVPTSSQSIVYHWPTLMQENRVLVKAEVKAVNKKSTSLIDRIIGRNPASTV